LVVKAFFDMAKRRYGWGIAATAIVLLAVSVWTLTQPALARQDGPNLLTNGSLERPFYGQGSPTRTVPQGWNLWVGAGAPDAFPHTDPVQILDGEVSWNIKQGYTVFTAAAYQTVGGLTAGDAVKLTGYGWVYTCNDTTNSCIIENPPYRQSDTSAGASLKVGIDPKGGTNPVSADVVWSAAAAPYDQWVEMSVSATAEGGSVTVFLYMTQSAGLAMNNVYWDKISLVRTDAAAVAEPTSAEVPFVVPQNVRPDGSIVHIVQAGDTLSSIAYAYSEYGVTNESIAALNDGMKANTRFLQLGQEVMILPPGSVDPATGQLLSPGAVVSTPTPTTSSAAAAATIVPTPTAMNTGETGEATQPTAEATQPAPADASQVTYATIRAAYMPFERGIMFWLEDTNKIYVLAYGSSELQGAFSAYQDTWREGMPETDSNIQPPDGFVQPDRGFGQAWRTYPGVRDALGWGTSGSQGYTGLVVHQDNNVIVNGPNNRVYQLGADGTWQAIDYYYQAAAN
jgi:hypothetical protein